MRKSYALLVIIAVFVPLAIAVMTMSRSVLGCWIAASTRTYSTMKRSTKHP